MHSLGNDIMKTHPLLVVVDDDYSFMNDCSDVRHKDSSKWMTASWMNCNIQITIQCIDSVYFGGYYVFFEEKDLDSKVQFMLTYA